jgi:hypothetical protein
MISYQDCPVDPVHVSTWGAAVAPGSHGSATSGLPIYYQSPSGALVFIRIQQHNFDGQPL